MKLFKENKTYTAKDGKSITYFSYYTLAVCNSAEKKVEMKLVFSNQKFFLKNCWKNDIKLQKEIKAYVKDDKEIKYTSYFVMLKCNEESIKVVLKPAFKEDKMFLSKCWKDEIGNID